MQRTVGHYHLQEEIGVGSMGAVYRAVDTRLNRVVAIKVWRADENTSVESARRMLREARAASGLNHPNIVIIHEFGETSEGQPFIVQEFIDGCTLRDRLDERIPLPEALNLAAQIARALAAAHAAGVVHRDIKPENVMVRADGYAKVLDFGIAHVPDVASADEGTALETLANDLIGTPAYMSPEVMLGGTIGPAADVFALGVMLFEMLTGQQPFAAPTAMGVLTRIATETPPLMSSLEPGLPAALDALVHSMLEKEPGRRPSAHEIGAVLPAFANAPEKEPAQPARMQSVTVGREPELDALAQAYARVRAGQSTIVGVSGEPGIGKSTLLEAFMTMLQQGTERPTVVRVRCSETLAGSEAYLPVLDALDNLRSRSQASFGTLMRSIAPTWHAQLATTQDQTGGPSGPAAGASQERMKRELRAFLHEASRRIPLVWIIEDLHWADASTIDILNYVAGRLEDTHVMIVAAFRPSDMALAKHPFLAVRRDLQAMNVYSEIALGLLTQADVGEYLSLRYPGNAFSAAFVEEIYSRTDGSPLFMADLVRYLRDTGAIIETDGVWNVAATRAGTARDLPESVRGMIARKIERVNEADRKLLLAASVQGQEFESAAVAEALKIDAADVEERLEALQEVHGLIQRGDEAEYPDGSLTVCYRFVHVLYQNVLFASLQPSRRAALSGDTARSLAAHHAPDAASAAVRLAVLFETARDFAAAGQYFSLAAQRAVSLFGFREALSLAERGLEGVAKLPDGPARKQLELVLQMTRGLALRLVRGWAAPELEPTLARARQLCQELRDPPELFPVMWNLAFFNMIRGNLAQVQDELETLTAQAGAADEPAFLMAACHLAGVTCEFMGNVQRSSELLEQARELHDPRRHAEYRAMFGMDPGMIARAMSSRPLWALGYPDRALARSRETTALSESQREPVTFTFALIVLQGVHLFRGEAREAIALGDQIIALCAEYEFAQEVEWGRAFQGAAYCLTGELERGVEQLRASLAAQTALRSGLVRTMFLSLLADAYARSGRVDEGIRVVDEGFVYAESSLERGFLHELHRVRGELLFRAGRLVEAEASLREAVLHAQRRAARSFELRAATSLARLWIGSGRSSEARKLLPPLLDWFTEGLGTADLVAASTLLMDING